MMRLELGIEDSRAGDISVIAFSGDLDDFSAQKAHSFFIAQMDAGVRRMVVSLEDVKFVDSVGLGVLIQATKRLTALGGRLIVVATKPHVVRLMETTGLISSKRLVVMAGVSEAIDLI
jgi:anti-sigma B factor antagonist